MFGLDSIVCAGKDCGLLEVITDSQSLDALKKKAGCSKSFLQIFQEACGRNPVTGQLDPFKLEVRDGTDHLLPTVCG